MWNYFAFGNKSKGMNACVIQPQTPTATPTKKNELVESHMRINHKWNQNAFQSFVQNQQHIHLKLMRGNRWSERINISRFHAFWLEHLIRGCRSVQYDFIRCDTIRLWMKWMEAKSKLISDFQSYTYFYRIFHHSNGCDWLRSCILSFPSFVKHFTIAYHTINQCSTVCNMIFEPPHLT